MTGIRRTICKRRTALIVSAKKQTVTVYRLITKGTIEEKILQYQNRKVAPAQALVEEDKGGFKNLTREELLNLFSFEGRKT